MNLKNKIILNNLKIKYLMAQYKIRNWIDINKLNWEGLSSNSSHSAIYLLENNTSKINLIRILANSSAII